MCLLRPSYSCALPEIFSPPLLSSLFSPIPAVRVRFRPLSRRRVGHRSPPPFRISSARLFSPFFPFFRMKPFGNPAQSHFGISPPSAFRKDFPFPFVFHIPHPLLIIIRYFFFFINRKYYDDYDRLWKLWINETGLKRLKVIHIQSPFIPFFIHKTGGFARGLNKGFACRKCLFINTMLKTFHQQKWEKQTEDGVV